jgi:hypothetical protein
MNHEEPAIELEVRHGVMRPGWYWWAAMIASSLLAALGAVGVALHTQAESERKWCSVVGTLDDSYRRQPPTTPTGMSVAKSIHDLRRELHCPAGD